ncbi:MAG: energy-coupled thiamine transporter ThiT [Ruminococcaceae bacterium]|nr:energy-coupled thiamine transporter ThiT [Oscillospiraceae bacterium]
MKKNNTYRLVVTALFIAIAIVLSVVTPFESLFVYGGGVTLFSQVPIIALSFIFGPAWGLVAGFIFSLFQLMFGLSNLAYAKTISAYLAIMFIDYILPFTMLGIAGIFKNSFKNRNLSMAFGATMVSLFRFLCHFLTGITVWKQYADGNTLKAILTYSFAYNVGYMVPETIITVIGILALNKLLFPRLNEDGTLK